MTNTGSWDPVDTYTILLLNVPQGESTLEFEITGPSSGFAGNFDYLKIIGDVDYSSFDQCPGTITLANGNYSGTQSNGKQGIRYQSGGDNVGYIYTGNVGAHDFYCTAEGIYNLKIGLMHYQDTKMTAEVIDKKTGTTEVSTDFAITSELKGSYHTQTILLPATLTQGLKTLKLTFNVTNGSTSYICNYKGVSLEAAPNVASFTKLTFDGEDKAIGDITKDYEWDAVATEAKLAVDVFSVPSDYTVSLAVTQATTAPADDAYTSVVDEDNISLPVPTGQLETNYCYLKVANSAESSVIKIALHRKGQSTLATSTVYVDATPLTTEEFATLKDNNILALSGIFTDEPRQLKVIDCNGKRYRSTFALDGDVYEASVTMGDGNTYTITVDKANLQPVNTNFSAVLYQNPSFDPRNTDLKITLLESKNIDGNFYLQQPGVGRLNNQGTTTVDGANYSSYKMSNGSVYQLWNDSENVIIKAITLHGKSNYDDGKPKYAITVDGATITTPRNTWLPMGEETTFGAVTFLIDGAQPQSVINIDAQQAQCLLVFEVHYELKQNVTFRDGYASYAPIANVQIPEGVKAYKADEVNGESMLLRPVEGNLIEKNAGVMLRSELASAAFITTTEAVETESMLTGSGEGATVEASSVYVLGKVNDVVGFYNYTGTTIPAYKAYLEKSKLTSGAKQVLFSFDGEDDGTTGIAEVKAAAEHVNKVVYSVSGQRVEKPVKGLYIVNGKKVVVK